MDKLNDELDLQEQDLNELQSFDGTIIIKEGTITTPTLILQSATANFNQLHSQFQAGNVSMIVIQSKADMIGLQNGNVNVYQTRVDNAMNNVVSLASNLNTAARTVLDVHFALSDNDTHKLQNLDATIMKFPIQIAATGAIVNAANILIQQGNTTMYIIQGIVDNRLSEFTGTVTEAQIVMYNASQTKTAADDMDLAVKAYLVS